MDVTQTTVQSDNLESGATALDNKGDLITGSTTVGKNVNLDWQGIKQCVNNGVDPSFLPIGAQIQDKWTWRGVTYDVPWNVVHYNSNGMYLQWEYATPEAMQFDAQEAIYYVGSDGLAAGTYYFSIGYTSGQWTTEKHIQFTLANDCDPGDQFVLSNIKTSNDPTASRTITVYGFGSAIAKQTTTTSNGTSGTELGTFGADGTLNSLCYQGDGNQCNGILWAQYGNHRWSQSAIRQWLNSDAAAGEWWQPMNPWDRPPSNAATRPGFLSGYSEEFRAMLEPTAVVTALDTVSGFKQATETTYDKVFLPNAWQLYSSYGADLYDGEGESWDYWKQRAEDAGIQGMMNDTTEARNLLKKYQINATSAVSVVHLRSPNRTGYQTRNINNGNFISGSPYSSCNCCPACIIKKSTPSYLTPSNLDWATIKKMTGTDFEIGSQIIDSWTASNDGTVWDVPWDIVHYDDTGMILQWHYTLPFSTEVDYPEALYYVGENGLPAGQYYISAGYTDDRFDTSKHINFVLNQACDPGDQLVLGASNAGGDVYNCTLRVYGFGETTAKQTTTTSDSTEGIELGSTYAEDTSSDYYHQYYTNGNVNAQYRILRGYGSWKQSAIRQWLNSDAAAGEWWTPQNPWDRPPSYASYPGFLHGFSSDFKRAIGYVENKTACCNLFGGIDTTMDRIFLPSMEQMNFTSWIYGVEGEPWQYYKNIATEAGISGRLSGTVPQIIKYDISSTNSARNQWLRTINNAALGSYRVNTNGAMSSYHPYINYYVCPCCKINLVK